MSNPVADAAERARALDPTESFIVQAPAGSGKTELLIQRYLRLLARVERPESVLAITFTRKATGEMRGRVLEALRSAGGPEPGLSHNKQTWRLARSVLAKDAEHGWQLLENPSRLRIQTIDALCASIVRQAPWLSRFGAVPAFEEKAEPYYKEAAGATLELLETDEPGSAHLEFLLHHLDNAFDKAEDLLVAMLAKRDQWLRPVMVGRSVPSLRREMEEAFQRVIHEALERTVSALPGSTASALVRWGRLEGIPGTQPDDLPAWLRLRERLLTQKGELRKNLENDPSLNLSPDDEFVQCLRELGQVPAAHFEDAQWNVLEALLELLPVAAAQLILVFQRRNIIDFQELAAAALRALGTPLEPTGVAYSLDERIQHILVDEFQDTSYSQYELIRALTSDWMNGDGRTLFVVGDPMQSIYLFRDAEVGLFLRARREGIGQVKLTPLQLRVNFRSTSGLIDWLNDTFPAAFSEEEDSFTGAVAYQPLSAFHPADAGPAVAVHPFFEAGLNGEAHRIVELIQQARQGNPKSTVAILVRARSHLSEAVQLLRRAGLRFRAVEIDALGGRSVALDLLSLTRALLHLADRRSWLAILRAPWCGLTLADLQALAGCDHTATIWDLLNNDERLAALSEDGRSRAVRIRDALGRALSQQGRLPLRNWIETTWITLGGPACLEDETSVEDAAAFFDLLQAVAVADQLEDPGGFEEQVSLLFGRPDVEAGAELQVMTIHKAKGLEFDTVIVPGLGRQPARDDPSLLLHLERPGPGGQAELLMAPIYRTGTKPDFIYDYLDSVRKEKEYNESTRLLYVAATRARKQLHLLGHVEIKKTGEMRSPHKHSLLRRIWEAVQGEFESSPPAPNLQRGAQAEPERAGVLLRRLPSGWRLPAPPEDVVWRAADLGGDVPVPEERPITFEWVSAMQRHVGTVVHAMLQRLAHSAKPEFEPEVARVRLASEGVPPGELDEAVRRVQGAIEATLDDQRGRWILSAHEDSRTELPLSGLLDGEMRHFVIDRTFVDEEGVRWVIDYKTSAHEGGGREAFLDNERTRYEDQLQRYAALMRHMDDRPIRLGLYFPLLRGWREWSFEQQRSFGFAATP